MTKLETEREFEVLLTASEAYPRLEQEFMSAEREVIAGFRVFDPDTRLRSENALAIGATWVDLITDTLNRGVHITLITTDFDPVVCMDMHYYAWQCHKGVLAAGEASDHPENLSVRTLMHPARLGLLPRTLLWWRSVKEVRSQLERLTEDEGIPTAELVETAPQIRKLAHEEGGKLRPRIFPPPPLVPVSHHQKLAVFDGSRLYIGGLDLNDRRYDTPQHLRDGPETWHDVQVLVTGQVAKDARAHLLNMEDGFGGKDVPRPTKLLRTMSAKRRIELPFMSPRPIVNEIALAHEDAIARANELIYFETQFFRDENLAHCLAARARQQPGLNLIMMLPAAPENIAFTDIWGPDAAFGEHLQAKCIDIVRDAFGARLFLGSPAQKRTQISDGRDTHFDAPIVYLHAKVSIFDDHTGMVSSANLNGRSMSWDTEAGVQTEAKAEVAQLKQRCFDHWLQDASGPRFFETDTALAAWTELAWSNARQKAEARTGLLLPYLVEPGKEDAQFLPGVPPEMA